MGKYSRSEKERMVEEVRRLHIQNFDPETISRFVGAESGLSADTVRKWIVEYDMEQSKKANILQRPQIMNAILQSFQDVLDGNSPKIKPLEAAQYASAFEKLSDKKKLLAYTMEAFNMLTDEIISAVESTKSSKEKKDLFELARSVRIYCDKVVSKLNSEVLND